MRNDGMQAAHGARTEPPEVIEDREKGVLLGSLLIDASELAERLGYRGERGARTVREKAGAGEIPFVRLGRELRFHWPTVIKSFGLYLVASGEPCQRCETRE